MRSTSGHWIHDLNPVLIQITDTLAIRYYGLAYALAFILGYYLLTQYRKHRRSLLNADQESEIIFACVIGVMVGGRLGYMLLYDTEEFLSKPLIFFRIWEGGMASHGGFVGVAAAAWWFTRKNRIPFLHLGDLLVTLAPIGFLLGRIANFINGELWGKVSDVSWAVVFPMSAEPGMRLTEIPARHPSQLYEAFLEGLILLVFVQWRIWKSKVIFTSPGRLSGEFILLYTILRVIGEHFREPDASLILGLSRGAFYSIIMAAAGIYLVYYGKTKSKSLNEPEPADESTNKK